MYSFVICSISIQNIILIASKKLHVYKLKNILSRKTTDNFRYLKFILSYHKIMVLNHLFF